MSVPLDARHTWVRLTPTGRDRLAQLQTDSANGTLSKEDTILFLALTDMLDYGEYCARTPWYGDRWVQRFALKRRKALAEAEKAWIAQDRAVGRQTAREMGPDRGDHPRGLPLTTASNRGILIE